MILKPNDIGSNITLINRPGEGSNTNTSGSLELNNATSSKVHSISNDESNGLSTNKNLGGQFLESLEKKGDSPILDILREGGQNGIKTLKILKNEAMRQKESFQTLISIYNTRIDNETDPTQIEELETLRDMLIQAVKNEHLQIAFYNQKIESLQ